MNLPETYLDEEKLLVRKMVRDLVTKEIKPRATEIDTQEIFPWENFRLLARQNLLAMIVPENYGGAGGDFLTYSMVLEELARGCVATTTSVVAHTLCAIAILLAGTEEQKQKYLPGLVDGTLIGAYALTEPGAGSDAGGVSTKAVRQEDCWVLNGTKHFITNGEVADIVAVVATTDKSKGVKGLGVFLVEKGTPGFSYGKTEKKMGIRGSVTSELVFDNCTVPAANLLGQVGQGFYLTMQSLDRTRPCIGALSTGLAQAALDEAVAYANQRKQFGQLIGEFQTIQIMLADMATKVQAARLLSYEAASKVDRNAPDMSAFASMAKLFASATAMQVATDAVQILGGYGYMREYPLERLMRDAKITQIYEGTNQIQRLVIARHLLGQ